MFKKSLALILLTVLVLTSFVIPAYADSVIGEIGTEEMGPIENDRVPLKDSYTEDELKSILAGDHNFDIPDEGLAFNAENFPLDVDENVVSPNIVDIVEDDYYIAVQETGKILIAPNSTYITTTNYSESEAYMWEFDEVSAYTYAIRNKLNPDTCLAASPSSSGNSAVVKKTYSATDVTCHWSMHVYNSGNVLRSEATGTNAAGQYLYISGNQFVLSTSSRTKIGLIDVDWFIPCTTITLDDFDVVVGKSHYVYPTFKGSSGQTANVSNTSWVNYTVTDSTTNVVTISSNLVTARSVGIKQIKIQHKITGAIGYAYALAQPMDMLDVTFVHQAKSQWCWAACAEMVGKYLYPQSDRDQWDVVDEVIFDLFEQYPNKAGSLKNGKDGTEYVTYDNFSCTIDNTVSDITWSDMIEYLSNGPVQASLQTYKNGQHQSGHRVVIVQCYISGQPNNINYHIKYLDPWETNASSAEKDMLYSEFRSHTVGNTTVTFEGAIFVD